MHAVLRIDLQTITLVFIFDVLVHTGRAITRFGPRKLGQVNAHRHTGVFQGQVSWLIFFVVGVADEHTRQTIKRELAIGLWVLNGLAIGRRLEVSVVGCSTSEGPWHMAAQYKLLNTRHEGAHRAAFFEPLLEVARFVQLGVQPAAFKGCWIGQKFVMLTACL